MMYDGHLIDRFIELVDERLTANGYTGADKDDRAEEPPEIPFLEAV